MQPTCFYDQPNLSEFLNKNYMINLPVVDSLLSEYQHLLKQESLKNTVIVYIHHALQTSISVINSLLMLGAKPSHIYILGKSYSENKDVVKHLKALGVYYIDSSFQSGYGEYKQGFEADINHLWALVQMNLDANTKDILILDHGGHAIKSIPRKLKNAYQIIGIEKTSAGTMGYNDGNKPEIPIINVAGCAAKRFLESPLIASAVSSKVERIIQSISKDKVCSVVGYGAIGKSVARLLESQGKKVLIYDLDHSISSHDSLEYIIEQSDYVFGCTGTDITSNNIESILQTKRSKVFLSCSSEDKEFLSLLKEITKEKTFYPHALFDEIIFNTKNGGNIILAKGGFPVNFDDSGESVPAQDIQLTRALVVGGIIDSIILRQSYHRLPKDLIKLSCNIQKFIVSSWSKERLCTNEIPDLFLHTGLIEKESLGIVVKNAVLENELFGKSRPYIIESQKPAILNN